MSTALTDCEHLLFISFYCVKSTKEKDFKVPFDIFSPFLWVQYSSDKHLSLQKDGLKGHLLLLLCR